MDLFILLNVWYFIPHCNNFIIFSFCYFQILFLFWWNLLFYYLSLKHYILNLVSPSTLSLHCPPSSSSHPAPLFPWINFSSISFQKRATLPVMSTEHSIMRCNKTSHKPFYQATWQPSRIKALNYAKESEVTPLPPLGVTQKHQAKHLQHACMPNT